MKFLRLSSTAAVLTIAFAGPAMAADVNTYRPGQVYAASPMPNADVCAMQCSGTAQCYGWNFLRSGNPDGSGICELNATGAAAVGHPYAVSGDNGGRTYGASNVVRGQSRTFRIGSPQAAMPASPVVRARAATPPQRRNMPAPVVRKRTYAPAANAASRPAAPQAARAAAPRPQTKPAATPTPQMTLTQQQAMQIAAKQDAARRAASAPKARPIPAARLHVQPAATPRIPSAAPRAPYAGHRMPPRGAQPVRAPLPSARSAAAAYQQARPETRQRPQVMPMPAQAPVPPSNLYGSLYDAPVGQGPTSGQAVAAFGRRIAKAKAKAAPQSITPPMMSETKPADPNAPVSTAVPVKPVETSGLEMAGPSPQ